MIQVNPSTPSFTDALRDCADASENLLANRMQLLDYDLRVSLEATVRQGARYSLSGLFALAGAGALALGAGLYLCAFISPPAAASLMGAGLLAVAALVWPRDLIHQRRRRAPGS